MFAGVDGCKGGWVVAMAPEWPPSPKLMLGICRDFESVAAFTCKCSRIAVDMPIGLPEDSSDRVCDKKARDKLVGAKSRVFPCPPRQAVQEDNYDDFRRTHRRVAIKSGSRQAFEISPKIRELDRWITPDTQDRVREFHPELVWLRYAGKAPISKHGSEGVNQRVEILSTLGFRRIEELKVWKAAVGAAVKLDDLLDALVGLELASRIPHRAATVPRNPPTDPRGLRMEMWY
ncbi:MAG: DUF429 domain-containing protein [Candidatus Hydrogenedentota bacterium]